MRTGARQELETSEDPGERPSAREPRGSTGRAVEDRMKPKVKCKTSTPTGAPAGVLAAEASATTGTLVEAVPTKTCSNGGPCGGRADGVDGQTLKRQRGMMRSEGEKNGVEMKTKTTGREGANLTPRFQNGLGQLGSDASRIEVEDIPNASIEDRGDEEKRRKKRTNGEGGQGSDVAHVREHELTHVPNRDWLSALRQRETRKVQHIQRRQEVEEEHVPKLTLDYFYSGFTMLVLVAFWSLS